MLYLGIDIGKRKHVASLIDEKAKVLFKAFSFSNTIAGANSLLGKLAVHTDETNVEIGMEATGHYWLSIYSFFIEKGFTVHVVNPIQTDGWRKGTEIFSLYLLTFYSWSFIFFALRQHQQYHMSPNQSRENQKVFISDIYIFSIVMGGANTDYFTVFFFGNKLHSKQHSEQIHAVSKRGVVFIFYHFFISSVCSSPKLTAMAWSICFIVLSSTVETYLPRRDLSIVLICSSSAIDFFMPSAAKMICVGKNACNCRCDGGAAVLISFIILQYNYWSVTALFTADRR